MTAADLAEYLQVSRATVYKLMRREKGSGFPAVKLANHWLVDLEEVQNWMVRVLEPRKRQPRSRQTSGTVKTARTVGGKRSSRR